MAIVEVRTFGDIQDAILRRGKIEDTTENRTAIKEYTNTLYQQICREEAYRWSGENGFLVLKQKYTTGTLTATNASDTVTGSSTSWVENDHRNLNMKISGGSYPYTVLRVASTTSIVLDSNWLGSTTAGLSYAIYRSRYGLFPDFQDIRSFRIPGLSVRMQPRPIPPSKMDQLMDRYPFREGTPRFYTIYGNAIYTAKTWATFNLGTDYFEDTLETEPRNPALVIWPAIQTVDKPCIVRYSKTPYPLNGDDDIPWIPYEDRAVLVWGVLAERFVVNRDNVTARDWEKRYIEMKKKMAADIEITDEELVLSVDASKYSRNRSFLLDEDYDSEDV